MEDDYIVTVKEVLAKFPEFSPVIEFFRFPYVEIVNNAIGTIIMKTSDIFVCEPDFFETVRIEHDLAKGSLASLMCFSENDIYDLIDIPIVIEFTETSESERFTFGKIKITVTGNNYTCICENTATCFTYKGRKYYFSSTTRYGEFCKALDALSPEEREFVNRIIKMNYHIIVVKNVGH